MRFSGFLVRSALDRDFGFGDIPVLIGSALLVSDYDRGGTYNLFPAFARVCVREVSFELEVSGTTEEPPAGFLFLCPPEDFKTGPSSFQWPDCPAYWSLDPSGGDRPSTKRKHGLDSLAFTALLNSVENPGMLVSMMDYKNSTGPKGLIQTVWKLLGIWATHFLSCRPKSIRCFLMGTSLLPRSLMPRVRYHQRPAQAVLREAEMLALSGTLKLLMIAQLVLLLFLGLSWLYEWM
ncbi:hypothetical protein B0H14DRAFT_3170143 [Mycena olivaceomarginata]|nr:hypothetical protein B0H14DRAFT_3170143 [Mycena olivaceomarginata]